MYIGETPSAIAPDLKVFPNPFAPSDSVPMRFTNIPAKSVMRIYTLSGKLVTTLKEEDFGGEISWNGKNKSGKKIQPGLYVYVLTDEQGKSKTGRIVIKR